MKRADLTEFEIEEENLKLRIARKSNNNDPVVIQPQQPPHAIPQPVFPAPVVPVQPAPVQPSPVPSKEPEINPEKCIKSPMVGTFYIAPSPDSDPFVKEGDSVTEETTICIIEAMKVMNEIKAEKKGRISKVLISDGDTVEYGQPIFVIED
jgi:acetyl-CoA carboxylase biotin carboxyl carrier protein